MLLNLGQYDRKNLCSLEKLLFEDASDTDTVGKSEGECLTQEQASSLTEWAEKTLSNKVKKVKVSSRTLTSFLSNLSTLKSA